MPQPEVRLWLDWCTARGVKPDRAAWGDVQRFTVDLPAADATVMRRLGAIRAHYQRRRQTLAGAPARAVASLWPRDAKPDLLRERLWNVPSYGYPHAITGRRDAAIHVLAAHGWTRAQIVTAPPTVMSVEVLPMLDGDDVDMANHGLRCAQCAITRWLRLLASWWDPADGPYATERCVEDRPEETWRHDCSIPVPDGWQRAPRLVCQVHRDGTILNGRIDPRDVTRALARSLNGPEEPPTPTQPPEPATAPAPVPTRAPSPTAGMRPSDRIDQLREIDDLLDDLDQAIAAAEESQDYTHEHAID